MSPVKNEKPWLILIPGFRCLKCGYEWVPREIDSNPQSCPDCRTRTWREE